MDLLDPTHEATLPTTLPTATMFERLAADPNVPVEKLEKLIEMQERIMRFNAEMAFNSAFSEMSAAMPTVGKNGKSLNGPYATLEDIIEATRPVLHRFGFAMSHKTTQAAGKILVTGILTHRQGHAMTSEFEASADTSGNKNAIQALGSANSYGRRYTTKDLLNIATRLEDDNGRSTSAPVGPELATPLDFDAWFTDLEATADLGHAALSAAWDASRKEHKAYLVKTNRKGWEAIKARAQRVSASTPKPPEAA
jgi:hypothetical protein